MLVLNFPGIVNRAANPAKKFPQICVSVVYDFQLINIKHNWNFLEVWENDKFGRDLNKTKI